MILWQADNSSPERPEKEPLAEKPTGPNDVEGFAWIEATLAAQLICCVAASIVAKLDVYPFFPLTIHASAMQTAALGCIAVSLLGPVAVFVHCIREQKSLSFLIFALLFSAVFSGITAALILPTVQ